MYATLNYETRGTNDIEVKLIPSDHSPFFVIELRDDGGTTTIMLSPDQLAQIIEAATAEYAKWQPPVEAPTVSGPTCDVCGREAKLRNQDNGTDNYDWVTSDDDGDSYYWRCLDDRGNKSHVCTVDHKDYATKSFADLHAELVIE